MRVAVCLSVTMTVAVTVTVTVGAVQLQQLSCERLAVTCDL